MADNLPFDVDAEQARLRQQQQPQQGPDMGTANQIAGFLNQPGAQAALLNFGISMMQPRGYGDTFAGQFGRAVGAGGEAATRGELQGANIEKSEALAEAARSRAGEAGARLEGSLERTRLQQRVKLAAGYSKYRSEIEDRNRKRQRDYEAAKFLQPDLQPPPMEPLMGLDEYLAQQERLTGGLNIPPPTGTSGAKPGGNAGQAPQNPTDRRVGQVYQTPKGPLRWMGADASPPWVAP
jgi:hypothetical protein